jgi:adenylate cyclase
MAELEALYYNPDPKGNDIKRAGWRKELPLGQPIKLGRIPELSDWCVEEDLSISRVNATLLWDGTSLHVEQPTDRKTSDIYYRDQPASNFKVAPGESFIIGTTRFTLHTGSQAPETPNLIRSSQNLSAEATMAREVLRQSPFENAEIVLRALEELPDVLRLVTSEDRLLQKLTDILLKAIGGAEAAAVVQLAPNATKQDRRVNIPCHKLRGVAYQGDFTPSRGLVYKAIREERKSVLWVWTPTSSPDFTIRSLPGIPWAICTPLRDASGVGFYVEGSLNREPTIVGGRVTDRELTGHQKVVELIASIIEASRKSHALERWLSVYKSYLPSTIRTIPDPDKLRQLLNPREAVVTVMFCDLRGSCRIVEEGEASLMQTWKNVANALDEMAQTITENDGVVAGFQGDAVMAFWGWPEDQPDQVERAVKAALRIRERFDREGWWKDLSCGIGITHGPAVVGALGTHDLAKVDVFGPTVNLASRLESMTKLVGVRVLVNEAVATVLAESRRSRGRTRKLARVRPAGMTNPQFIYELMPPSGDLPGQMPEPRRQYWEQIVDCFLAGDWAPARNGLENYFADDPAGELILDYMKRNQYRPPAGWDGIITFDTK